MKIYQDRQGSKVNPKPIAEGIEPIIDIIVIESFIDIYHSCNPGKALLKYNKYNRFSHAPGFDNVVLIVDTRVKAAKVFLYAFLVLISKTISTHTYNAKN